jgi:lipoteichoic acid synthase
MSAFDPLQTLWIRLDSRVAGHEKWYGHDAMKLDLEKLRAQSTCGLRITAPIIAAAFGFLAVAAAIRIKITYWDGAGWRQPLGALRLCFVDISLVSMLALLASLLAYKLRDRPTGRRAVQATFVLVTLLLSVFACVNVRALEILGAPLSYQWLIFAGDFGSRTARQSIDAAGDRSFWSLAVASLALDASVLIASFIILARLRRGRLSPIVLPCIVGGVGVALVASVHPWDVPKNKRNLLVNPVVELVWTAVQYPTSSLLLQRNTIAPEHLTPQTNNPADLPQDLKAASIRNVIVIALESVGAKYVATDDQPSQTNWTPNLASYNLRTLRFTNAYAHAGSTTKSLFSLVTGRPPLFSYMGDTEVFYKAQFRTLPEILKARGFRTAIFADLQYEDAGAFLHGRGFDVLADSGELECGGQLHDGCILNALMGWIGSGARPFFAVVWTHDTHWPYEPDGWPPSSGLLDVHDQRRYLAALRGSDAAIGRLLHWLGKRGLLSKTLVIVLGDHGEAFGEHGTYTHSQTMFEEELHIPMLLINDSIHGRRDNKLVSISDVPQTILHVLGAPPERSWDSRSFFEPVRPRTAFLFAEQLPGVGFREGNMKYMYDLENQQALAFNLDTDPDERRNIAKASTSTYILRRSAGWMQEQDRRFSATLH